MRLVHRSRIFFTLGGLLLGLSMPGRAVAQSIAEPKTWTVTPFLGSSISVDEPGEGNSLALGVAVGYDLTTNVGFEGELSHLFDIAGDSEDTDWSVTNFSGNFVYHFDVKRVTPYATFGLGFEHSSIDVKDSDNGDSGTEIAFNFGGGVKYPLTSTMLVRGDLRRFESNDLAPDYWRIYGGLTFLLGKH